MRAFETLEPGARLLAFEFEGASLEAPDGLSVAAALLYANQWHWRDTPVTGAARGPFCMMGTCFDCLVMIDGEPNQQACMTQLRENMRIARMSLTRAGEPFAGAHERG